MLCTQQVKTVLTPDGVTGRLCNYPTIKSFQMRYFRRLLLYLVLAGLVTFIIFGGGLILFRHTRKLSSYQTWSADLKFLIQPYGLRADKSVLICIISNVKDSEKRHAIRQSWGATQWLQVVFVTGLPVGPNALDQRKALRGEASLHNDIVQINVHEHYRNSTLRSIALVRWAAQAARVTDYRFVIKTNDDNFVNTYLLRSYMDHFTDGYLYGIYQKDVKVQRCHNSGCSKQALRKDEYYPDVFPPYLSGLFYIFTEDALNRINIHLFEPPLIIVEDVYITGLVAGRAGVSRRSIPENLKIYSGFPHSDVITSLNDSLLVQSNCDLQWQMGYWKHVILLLDGLG